MVNGSTRLHTTKSTSGHSEVRPPLEAGAYTAPCLYHVSSEDMDDYCIVLFRRQQRGFQGACTTV
jgi:hypothetical protein